MQEAWLKMDFQQKLHNSAIFGYFYFIFMEASSINTHIVPKYLDNIIEIFRGNIVRLLKCIETYH